ARIIEHFEHDNKIGKDIALSLSKLRKTYKPEPDNTSIDFFEIDATGETIESDYQESTKTETFDLSKCSNIDLIRMFAEFTAYKRFSEYLEQEKTKYADLGSIIGNAEISTESISSQTKDFTTARQVLAVHYLLKYSNVKDVDKTEIARFIQFLTGKNFDNIYKRLQNPFKVNDKALKEDLRFVRGYFERLKIQEVVKMINNEIDSYLA
ncbi:MAG: hypothetical protein WCI92_15310, partial [Bacteroidota bacterium]